MKIQIYKPHFKTKFYEEDNSFTFINPEIRNLVEILEQNNEIELLSSSDRKFKEIKNPNLKILVNGRLYKKGDENDKKVDIELEYLNKIFNNTTPQFQIVTDWKIIEKNKNYFNDNNFKNITACNFKNVDGELEKLFLYKTKIINKQHKKNRIIYIGNSRGNSRDEDLFEYLKTNLIDLYGNWDKYKFSTTKGKLQFKNSQNKISEYKYGLCLTEPLYTEKGHRTPRIWEYFRAGVYPFVDYKYPYEKKLIDNNDFRKVGSAEELDYKIKFLEKNPRLYENEIAKQFQKIKDEYVKGNYQRNKIEEILKIWS